MDIFVMYPDGCGQQKLVKEPLVVGTPINEARYDGMPAWSKDTKKIVFASNGTPCDRNTLPAPAALVLELTCGA